MASPLTDNMLDHVYKNLKDVEDFITAWNLVKNDIIDQLTHAHDSDANGLHFVPTSTLDDARYFSVFTTLSKSKSSIISSMFKSSKTMQNIGSLKDYLSCPSDLDMFQESVQEKEWSAGVNKDYIYRTGTSKNGVSKGIEVAIENAKIIGLPRNPEDLDGKKLEVGRIGVPGIKKMYVVLDLVFADSITMTLKIGGESKQLCLQKGPSLPLGVSLAINFKKYVITDEDEIKYVHSKFIEKKDCEISWVAPGFRNPKSRLPSIPKLSLPRLPSVTRSDR